jgi:hypothetical protein
MSEGEIEMNAWQKVLAGAVIVSVCAIPAVGFAKEGKGAGMRGQKVHAKHGVHGKKGHNHDRADRGAHGRVFDALITLAVEKYAPDTLAAWTTALTDRDNAKKAIEAVRKQLRDAKVRPPKDAKPVDDHETIDAQRNALIDAIGAKDAAKATTALEALRQAVTAHTAKMVQTAETLKKALPEN